MISFDQLERPKVQATQVASVLCAEAELADQLHLKQMGREDQTVNVKDKFWHVAAAKCIALNMSVDETAGLLDKHPDTIRNVMKHPTFQARVFKYMEEAGANIADLFQSTALAAHATLVEIMNDPKVAPSARIASAREILERGYGKSVTYIEAKTQTISADPHIREQELLHEIKTLRTSQDLVQDLSDNRETITLS